MAITLDVCNSMLTAKVHSRQQMEVVVIAIMFVDSSIAISLSKAQNDGKRLCFLKLVGSQVWVRRSRAMDSCSSLGS